LLQNSDDARSKAVEIRFETEGYLNRNDSSASPVDEYLPDLKTALVRDFRFPITCLVDLTGRAQVHKWTFKNNGSPFEDQDWNRLKKIGMQGFSVGLLHS